MKNLISLALKKAGIDHAIFATLVNRSWSAAANFATIAALAFFLTAEEQGYYYTFASFFSLQVFFELGFTFVLTQFSAYEFAKIHAAEASAEERNRARARLRSIIDLSNRWFLLVAIGFWITVTFVGWMFFAHNKKPGNIASWEWPWLLANASFSVGILLLPINAILEGCKKIKEVAYVRVWQDIFGYTTFWLLLALGAGLYSIIALHALRAIIAFVIIKRTGLLAWLLNQASEKCDSVTISWKREIFPFQWRISVSWISGYLIFNMFSPVMFAYHGPKVAGQMGMTLAIFSGISSLTMAWITTKVPQFCELIALDRAPELKALFLATLKKAMAVNIFMVALGTLGITFASAYVYFLTAKFLPAISVVILAITSSANFFVFAVATYLRSFKEEPFLALSIALGLLTATSTLFLGKQYGPLGASFGYMASTILIAVPYAIYYLRKKLIY